jgi:hypothetical protein
MWTLPTEWADEPELLVCVKCHEPLGRLAWIPLHRHARFPITFEFDRELRSIVEAQAPLMALRGLLWVLPEGFVEREGVWCMTRRGQRRRWLARHGGAVDRAKHRSQTIVGGVSLFAWAPALPARILCPRCGCKHYLDAAGFAQELDHLASLFNRNAASLTDAEIEQWVLNNQDLRIWLRIVARQLGLATTQELTPEMAAEALRWAIPQHALVQCVRSGVVLSRDDFFVVELPHAFKVGLGDPSHMKLLGERAIRWLRSRPRLRAQDISV